CARRRRTVRRSRPCGRTAARPDAPPWRRRTGASGACVPGSVLSWAAGRPVRRRPAMVSPRQRPVPCRTTGAEKPTLCYTSPYGAFAGRRGPAAFPPRGSRMESGRQVAGLIDEGRRRAHPRAHPIFFGGKQEMASRKLQRHTLAAAVFAACLSMALSAQAQEAAQAAPGGQDEADKVTTLATMTVTAQKREEVLQDVPISVTVLDQQLLQDTGVHDIKDLQVLVPGLTVTSTQSEAITTARIRG